MKLKLIKNYNVKNNVSVFFLKNHNIFFLKNYIGFFKIYMPMNYFFFKKDNNYNFLFIKKNNYYSILKQFLNFYKNLVKMFFFKLRLRGLGYRIKKISMKLYRFFFGVKHYFYFHISNDIFVKHRHRNIFIFSNNLSKLNDIFSHLLLLKKLDFYERNNSFIISHKVLFFKKRKK